MALGVLCILLWENSWIPKEDKRHFYLTYGIIALAALAEWTGIQLNGNESIPKWVLAGVKCADYVLTPLAGGALAAQMKLRNRWHKALKAVLTANTLFQIVACFNRWMLVIDDQNHYSHGPLYTVYILVYLLVIILMAAQFLSYGKSYRRQNRASLYSVLLLVIVGIGIQELLGSEYRTAYIALTMGVTLMFIHYSEFYQMHADEHIRQQYTQLMTDALTGVLSRHAYMKALERYADPAEIPGDLAAFSIDINGLKTVNDTIGHEAGDELITGAARCIAKVFTGSECFRTGGDEFIVLTRMEKEQADAALLRLEQETASWTGTLVKSLNLAAGYALVGEHPGITVEKLVIEADHAMYARKAAYYRESGHDRRSRRTDPNRSDRK